MRLKLFLAALCWSQLNKGVAARFNIKVTECDKEIESAIAPAFETVEDMLNVTVDRVEELLDGEDWSYYQLSLDHASIVRTIISFIHPALEDKSIYTKRERDRNLKAEVEEVRNISSVMLKKWHDPVPINIEVACGTDWLEPQASPNVYRDGRQSVYNDDERQLYKLSPGWKPFSSIARNTILVFHDMAGPYRTLLLLNPFIKTKWPVGRPRYSFSIRELRNRSIAGGIRLTRDELSLDDIVEHNLAPDLLDALSRLRSVADDGIANTQRLGDPSPSEDLGLHQRGYGWEYVRWLADEHPERSLESAISFKYLVTALYLARWDWSSGANSARGRKGIPA